MSTHTPGPWTCHSGMVWKDGPNVFPKGSGEDGIPIAMMCREPNNGTLPVERDANASLIAAAPELLEALNDLVQAHDVRMGPSAVKLRIDRARDAIAKVEGKVL